MARVDAFGDDPLSSLPKAQEPDASSPLIRKTHQDETIKRLAHVLRWTPVNRDTEQTQPLKTPDGTLCCIQRKTIDGATGPKYKYVILKEGHAPFEYKSLDDLLQVMSIEPLR